MPTEFTKCEGCGIIFANSDSAQTLCPKCRHEESTAVTPRDILRQLRNVLRDAQISGAFLTVPELAEKANTTEEQIWRFIHDGEIDIASFNDPAVRDYLVRKQRERLKAMHPKASEPVKPAAGEKGGASGAKRGGFHLRGDDRDD